LRQTFPATRRWSGCAAPAETPDGAELSLKRGFKYGEHGILDIVGHSGLLSIRLKTRIAYDRSVCQQESTKPDSL
jgi:hypothetical protein